MSLNKEFDTFSDYTHGASGTGKGLDPCLWDAMVSKSRMRVRYPILFFLVLGVLTTTAWLKGAPQAPGLAGKRAERIEEKTLERRQWGGAKRSPLADKRFPMKEWDKHFSPLGQKRAAINVEADGKKKRFDTQVREMPVKEKKLARWNRKIADLEKRARIQTSDTAEKIAAARTYDMLLQDTRHFEELGEEVSLRDINRFQFRRNRSDDGIPVEDAGSGGGE